MSLADFVRSVPNFASRSITERMIIFGWYLHDVKKLDRFRGADINACFDDMHMVRSSNVGSMLRSLAGSASPRVLEDAKGFRLSNVSREEMTKLFPPQTQGSSTTVLLRDLAARVSDPNQKIFLAEALICFNNKAYRSAIVMAWNLAYSHVCDVIFSNGLATFNAQLKVVRPRLDPISKKSDFEDHKESLVIEVARGSGLFSAATAKTLTEKLGKRNTAAHPSSTIVTSVTAEEVIHDLVENVLLRAVL